MARPVSPEKDVVQPEIPPGPTESRAVAPYERRPLHWMIAEAWRSRGLVIRIGVRTVAKGAAGTRLGWSWLVLGPAMPLVGMMLLFGGILGVPSGDVPYIPFLLAGTSAWVLLDRTVFWTTRSFEPPRRILRNLNVPPLVVPFSGGLMGGVYCVVNVGILLVALGIYWILDGELYLQLGPQLLVALAGYALGLTMAWAIGLWLAVLNAMARDVRLTLRYVLQIWLYVTPVLYPLSSLPPTLEFLSTVNPATAVVEMVKYGLLDTGTVETDALAVSLGFTIVVFAGGLVFFRSMYYRMLIGGAKQRPDDDEDEL